MRAPRRFSLPWWAVLVTLGGMVGLLAPVAALDASVQLGLPAWARYPMIALAGALQGLVVGMAQAFALHRTVIAVPRAGWALITMAGALVAWALGLVPVTFEALEEPLDLSSPPVLAAMVAGTLVLIAVVPAAQWLILRRVLPGAWLWIFVESVAIAVAIVAAWGVSGIVDVGRPLGDEPVPLVIGVGGVSLLFALVTGMALAMLAPRARSAFAG